MDFEESFMNAQDFDGLVQIVSWFFFSIIYFVEGHRWFTFNVKLTSFNDLLGTSAGNEREHYNYSAPRDQQTGTEAWKKI